MVARILSLALLALFLPGFLLPGRVAICVGENCPAAARELSVDTHACCCHHEVEPAREALCHCGAVTSPRREDAPGCPACVILEDGGTKIPADGIEMPTVPAALERLCIAADASEPRAVLATPPAAPRPETPPRRHRPLLI
ncbi:MAG: hypothetical protein R3F20_15170 [Planctomycetota bacterium]